LAHQPAYEHHRNPRRLTPDALRRASEAVSNLCGWRTAVDELRAWPEYTPQPLWSLDHTAGRLNIGRLYYKDESERFARDLGSFKALGAPYAVYSLLAGVVETEAGVRPTSAELRGDEFRPITEHVTVCVATDGNQGRGLAYAAKIFGCRCVTFVHREVSPWRKRAMELLGAVVIRIDGEYEASVARAQEDAAVNGWHFVSSTSWDEFRSPVPRSVMQAYMLLVEEALEQLPDPRRITHVVVQGGVGSIAAAPVPSASTSASARRRPASCWSSRHRQTACGAAPSPGGPCPQAAACTRSWPVLPAGRSRPRRGPYSIG
jgi:diaminopropionate ammonia-lyase